MQYCLWFITLVGRRSSKGFSFSLSNHDGLYPMGPRANMRILRVSEYNQSSPSVGSASMYSTNHRSKLFRKKLCWTYTDFSSCHYSLDIQYSNYLYRFCIVLAWKKIWDLLGLGLEEDLQCLLVKMQQGPFSSVPFTQEALGLCIDLGPETDYVSQVFGQNFLLYRLKNILSSCPSISFCRTSWSISYHPRSQMWNSDLVEEIWIQPTIQKWEVCWVALSQRWVHSYCANWWSGMCRREVASRKTHTRVPVAMHGRQDFSHWNVPNSVLEATCGGCCWTHHMKGRKKEYLHNSQVKCLQKCHQNLLGVSFTECPVQQLSDT